VRLRALGAGENRGLLLDLTVFALNLVLVRMLGTRLAALARGVSAGEPAAEWTAGALFAALFVLPAAGAVLRRWHFHQRRAGREPDLSAAWGCLLNPAFYLAVSLTIGSSAMVLLGTRVFGEDFDQRAEIFLPLVFGVLVLSIVQTVLVYRYLDPPRQPPRTAFGRGSASELLGDACIFVNAILFQVLWNAAFSGHFARPAGVEDALGRIFLLWFVSILVYFPPRIFYLAEEAGRRSSWPTMLLATSPVVLHVFGLI
jgi:hypothetical protein